MVEPVNGDSIGFHKSTLVRHDGANRVMSIALLSSIAAVIPSSIIKGRRQNFPATEKFIMPFYCLPHLSLL
jgi:hypothetical protein